MAFRSQVIHIENRVDIVDSSIQFSRRHHSGVCILSATGNVTDVTLRHPTLPNAIMVLHGCFGIISLTGSFSPGQPHPGSTGLTIYMAGAQGVVGGRVVGSLVASGAVMIMVATFSNAIYERSPLSIEDDEDQTPNGQQQLSHDAYSPSSRGHGNLFNVYTKSLTLSIIS